MAQLRDIGNWDEQYLKTLPVGEFDWLDFKESRWLDGQWIDEASQYVSAFANFDGGYLIVGVRDPSATGEIQIDGGVRCSLKNGIKEWLEDKLPSLVEYRLDRIEIQDVRRSGPGSEIKSDHCVIVIHVPPSSTAPHQARNHKYCTRLGSKLNALGHRAVMDIVNRPRNRYRNDHSSFRF
jgi:predicted HTH transcriptional regulator